MKNKKKKFEREAPNEEWFWKNRHNVWRLHPDMKINDPNKKEDNSE